MPDPANLTHYAIDVPDAQIVAAEVLDDATTLTDAVRCKLPDDATGATDPARWTPVTIAGQGTWFPKKGADAVIAFPDGEVDPILLWFQHSGDPDHPFE